LTAIANKYYWFVAIVVVCRCLLACLHVVVVVVVVVFMSFHRQGLLSSFIHLRVAKRREKELLAVLEGQFIDLFTNTLRLTLTSISGFQEGATKGN